MAKIFLKALIGLKGKGFYVFLTGIVILAACFHANNPSGRIAAAEEQERETPQTNSRSCGLIGGSSPLKEIYLEISAQTQEPKKDIPPNRKFPLMPEEIKSLTEQEGESGESEKETKPKETSEATAEETAEEITAVESETDPPETEPPETDPPETEPPETESPETAAPEEKEPVNGGYGQREQYGWEIEYADELFDLVNDTRARYGLSPLKKLDALTSAAVERAWEIGVYRSHTRPDGSNCFTVLSEHGLPLSKRAENISYYQSTPQSALNSFMSDYAHSAPILDGNFEYMGIGFYYIENDPTGAHYYWTQIFYSF